MRRLNTIQITTIATCCCLMSFMTGCGEVGGGASVVPNVKVKLGDTAVVDVQPTGDGDSDPAAGSGPGIFKGRVVLEGTAPTLEWDVVKGSKGKDAEVCAKEGVPSERLVVGEGNGVANVVVYLSKAPKGAPKTPVPTEPAVFDQKGCQFLPHILLVRKGQKLLIKSDDPIAHNTHTFPAKNSAFNSGIPANDRVGTEISYSSAESKPFAVKCDYHAWMTAYHLPLDHPYAAITKADGTFEIKDIPAGKHNFVIWHEGADGGKPGYLVRKFAVTVKAGESVEKTIPYPVSKFAP